MCTMRDNAQSGPNGILLYHYAHKTSSTCGMSLFALQNSRHLTNKMNENWKHLTSNKYIVNPVNFKFRVHYHYKLYD